MTGQKIASLSLFDSREHTSSRGHEPVETKLGLSRHAREESGAFLAPNCGIDKTISDPTTGTRRIGKLHDKHTRKTVRIASTHCREIFFELMRDTSLASRHFMARID